jgi:hypothetical protein
MLLMVLLRMNFFMFLKVLRTLEGLFADLEIKSGQLMRGKTAEAYLTDMWLERYVNCMAVGE